MDTIISFLNGPITRLISAATIVLASNMAPRASSAAQLGTFEALYASCKADPTFEKSAGGAYCVGYIDGIGGVMILNGIFHVKASKGGPSLSMCAPPSQEPTANAMVQAVTNFAATHPEYWQQPMLVGVMLALKSTWPCF
jgi:Rap1a immunity proteins